VREGDRLRDPSNGNQWLQYLHWAGFRIQPGCPYWEIWEHYRYLNEEKPEVKIVKPSLFKRVKQQAKRAIAQVST
jgi:hypothetical protein